MEGLKACSASLYRSATRFYALVLGFSLKSLEVSWMNTKGELLNSLKTGFKAKLGCTADLPQIREQFFREAFHEEQLYI